MLAHPCKQKAGRNVRPEKDIRLRVGLLAAVTAAAAVAATTFAAVTTTAAVTSAAAAIAAVTATAATTTAAATVVGGVWRMITWLRVFPAWLRDPFYKLVARTRYALFGEYRGKPLAESEWKDRFLADPR